MIEYSPLREDERRQYERELEQIEKYFIALELYKAFVKEKLEFGHIRVKDIPIAPELLKKIREDNLNSYEECPENCPNLSINLNVAASRHCRLASLPAHCYFNKKPEGGKG